MESAILNSMFKKEYGKINSMNLLIITSSQEIVDINAKLEFKNMNYPMNVITIANYKEIIDVTNSVLNAKVSAQNILIMLAITQQAHIEIRKIVSLSQGKTILKCN